MAVGYFNFDIWLNTFLKELPDDSIRYYEFRIFRNEDYLQDENVQDNLWDLQLVGMKDEESRPLFSTRNDFCTFEADMDWDDPMELITDCILKYLSDGKFARELLEAEGGIFVAMPEYANRRERI